LCFLTGAVSLNEIKGRSGLQFITACDRALQGKQASPRSRSQGRFMVSRLLRIPLFAFIAILVSGWLVSLAAMPAVSQRASTAVPSRITEPIDDSRRITLAGNVHPLAVSRFDRGEAPESTATGRLRLLLKRSAAQQQALEQYLADVQNAHSPSHYKWMTPAQFGAAFGVGDADLGTVEAWLQSHGFKIEKVPQGRNVIEFSGNFGQVKSAFHTAIHTLEVNGGEKHFAILTDPQIPAALQPVIAGVGTLNDFRPVSQAKFGGTGRYNPATKRIQPDFTLFGSGNTPYLFVVPADAATIYDTPNPTLNTNYKGTTYDGTGVNIGIVGDSNFTMQAVINYRTVFLNETAANANTPIVVVDGNDPLINGDEVEALLDNEVAGGIAPKAKLYFYTSAGSDLQSGLFNAIFRAVDDNTVSILNISFGGCEAALGVSGNQTLLEVLEQAAAQGISVTVAAGDSGSAGCDSDAEESAINGLQVSGFASTPYSIAVGGTDFDVLTANFTTYVTDEIGGQLTDGSAPYYGTALSYIPEEPWNDSITSNGDLASNQPLVSSGETDIVAGSGGVSSCVTSTQNGNTVTCLSGYAKPAFQTSLTPGDGGRDVPDVAFLSGNGMYSAVWAVCAEGDCENDNGQLNNSASFTAVGGTSASAPAFAGMLALVEQKIGSRLGQADTVLYQLAASQNSTVFHDVITGNNSVVCTSGSPNCGSNGFLTGYNAGTGYDLASGLGSVDAAQLVNQWNSVALTGTTAALTINGSAGAVNVTHGTNLTFQVGVAPSTASGVAAIVDNANETASGPQNNGQIAIPLARGNGSVQYNGLPGGTYSVYARYGGDTQDAASISAPIQVTISPEASTTALSVNAYSGAYNSAGVNPPVASSASIPYGSFVFADAQILGTAEGTATQGLATGSVTLTDNGTALASGLNLNSGNTAVYQSPSTATPAIFPIGPHSLVATYTGDGSYQKSSSTPVAFNVVKDQTSVVVNFASTSISSLQSDNIFVGVLTSSQGVYPTGTITLTSNGATLATLTGLQGTSAYGAVAVTSSVTLAGSALPAGVSTITITYSGDGNYTSSSTTANITVVEAGFTLSNAGAINIAAGATSGNTSQITVAPSNGFVGLINLSCAVTSAPTGASSPATCTLPATVNITGTASASAALAVNTTAATTAGSYVVTVTGTDATTGKISATTAVNVTVTRGSGAGSGSFALANSGPVSIHAGATTGNTATVTITPSNGFTGLVNLSCAVTTSISNPNDLPSCTIPASLTVSGTSAATATVAVTTTASTSAALRGSARFGLPGAALATVLLLGVPARRRRGMALFMMLAVAFTVAAIGCGGSGSHTTTPVGSSGTTVGAYTVTVTGTDAATGKIVETTAISVNVN
jgi:trimeric autotransporter adhesin